MIDKFEGTPPVTIEKLAAAKHIPPETLRKFGLTDTPEGVRFEYRTIDGGPARPRLRTAIRGAGGSQWISSSALPISIYTHPEGIDITLESDSLIVVEGESDCWTAWMHGIAACGIPGPEHVDKLEAGHVARTRAIYVLREPAPPESRTYTQGVAAYIRSVIGRLGEIGYRGSVYELQMPDGLFDLSELHRDDPQRFLQRLAVARESAEPLDLSPLAPQPLGGSSALVRSDPQSSILVGLVGTGFGKEHLRQLNGLSNVQIDWLGYGHDRERAEAMAQEHGIKHITDNWQQLVASPVNAVIIVTPVGSHYAIAKAALEAGKIVVCDKPLAANLGQAKELAALAALSPFPSMIFFQWRFHAGPRTIRSWLRSGILGSVQHIDLQFRHDFLAGQTTDWIWRHSLSSAGAGAFADLGVHLIDLLLWITGDDVKVIAASTWAECTQRAVKSGANRGAIVDCETEDSGQALLRTGRGSIASVYVSRSSLGFRSIRIVITGTAGSAILEIKPDLGTHEIRAVGIEPDRLPAEANSQRPYQVWLDAVRGRHSAMLPIFEDGARAQMVMEDIFMHAS